MSNKLNAGAFEFVPGRAFAIPTPQAAPGPPPIERPEQTEAPRPPPTISLNIGGSRPPAPAPAPAPPPNISLNIGKTPAVPASTPAAPAPTLAPSSKPAPSSTQGHGAPETSIPESEVPTAGSSSNKVFSTEKSKTDTLAVEREVIAVADQSVLEDLYGDGWYLLLPDLRSYHI